MMSPFRQAFAWISCALLTVGATSFVHAGPILYGDFGPDFPPGITIYTDVQESSGTDPNLPPLFGAPELTNDLLDFDPAGFVASATSGAADILDGQLNFGLMVLQSNDEVAGGITSLLLSERGDFSLFGAGSAITSVAGGMSIDIEILEVDGVPITPISVFASNAAVRDLVSDGPVVLAPWENGILIEFLPILIGNDVPYKYGVTKAEIVIDDQLIAISEPNSVAFIAKKDFKINATINPNHSFAVPEPASIVLMASFFGFGFLCRRRGDRRAA